jgi:hypothetical protein
MSPDELAMCSWPDLPPRYATALRAVVAFVFETFEPRAIVAAGSVVRGAGDRSSDLDIFVVQERPYKQRLQRWFGDVPVEIFVNPARAIRAYFASEHEHGRPSAAHMIATGFPVFGGQAIDALREEAAEWLKKPQAPSRPRGALITIIPAYFDLNHFITLAKLRQAGTVP